MKKTAPHTKTSVNDKFPKRLYRRTADVLYGTSLPEVLLATALILSRYYANSDFAYPLEILLPVIIWALFSSAIFYGYRLFLKSVLAVHAAALALVYASYNYSYVVNSGVAKNFIKVLPGNAPTDLTKSLLIFVIMSLTAAGLGWLMAYGSAKNHTVKNLQLTKVLLFAACFIFALQVLRCGQRLISLHEVMAYKYPAPEVKPGAAASNKPDIYYLIFDRYGNQDTLKKEFGYDNRHLLDYLASQGFANREKAYSNYPFTFSSVSSTLAMNYFPEFHKAFSDSGKWQGVFPYRYILNDPPVAQLLRQNGYRYNQVSSWWDFTRLRVKADTNPSMAYRLDLLGAHLYLSDLQRDILDRSILSPWLKSMPAAVIKYDLTKHPREIFEDQIASLKNIAGLPTGHQPQFTMAHVLVPHDPYIFEKDGSSPWYDSNRTDTGIDEKDKYVNQLTYLNKRIEELIDSIRQQSPNAVIAIQADEGPYPKEFRFPLTANHYYNPKNLPLNKMRQKFGILASYYLPGVSAKDAKQLNSSVNTFRFILNHYLNYNLPLLPDCHFAAGDKFNIFDYDLMNQQLEGEAAPECQQYL